MWRTPLIAVSLLALGFFVATASVARGAFEGTCAGKHGVVAGVSTCLTPGQACLGKRRADYARAGFTCASGRLKRVAPTTGSPPPPGASLANPVPFGKPGALGNGWTVTVTSVNTDATAAILAADPGNTSPLAGNQYVLVSVNATYSGVGSSHLTPGTSFHAIGASGVAHSTSNSFCGKLPSPNLDLDNPLVFKDKSITGYAACWMVSVDDVATLEMYWQTLLSTQQVWFALH